MAVVATEFDVDKAYKNGFKSYKDQLKSESTEPGDEEKMVLRDAKELVSDMDSKDLLKLANTVMMRQSFRQLLVEEERKQFLAKHKEVEKKIEEKIKSQNLQDFAANDFIKTLGECSTKQEHWRKELDEILELFKNIKNIYSELVKEKNEAKETEISKSSANAAEKLKPSVDVGDESDSSTISEEDKYDFLTHLEEAVSDKATMLDDANHDVDIVKFFNRRREEGEAAKTAPKSSDNDCGLQKIQIKPSLQEKTNSIVPSKKPLVNDKCQKTVTVAKPKENTRKEKEIVKPEHVVKPNESKIIESPSVINSSSSPKLKIIPGKDPKKTAIQEHKSPAIPKPSTNDIITNFVDKKPEVETKCDVKPSNVADIHTWEKFFTNLISSSKENNAFESGKYDKVALYNALVENYQH